MTVPSELKIDFNVLSTHRVTSGRLLSSHFIYPLTARVVWAPQMISQPVSAFLLCSPLPSGTWRTPGLSIPWCCFPTSSSVCLVFFSLPLILSTTIFFYTDFNFSAAFLAPFFRGLRHTLLVGLGLWLWTIGVQDLRMFPSVSHGAQFLVLFSSFFTLYLSTIWFKCILSQTSLLPMTHSSFTLALMVRYTPLFWPCKHTSLMWRPEWHKTNWNRMTTRQRLSL